MAYVRVGELDVYVDEQGTGDPLVLLPGGMLTLELGFGELLPRLTRHRRVIGIEMQGHGRTADLDRAPTPSTLAGDVVGVLDGLGVDRADVLGFSLGGLVALQTALDHPERVDRLVLASVHTRADGYHPEIHDPSLQATSTRMPSASDFEAMAAAYERLAPPGSSFSTVMGRLMPVVTADQNWGDEDLARVAAATLVMIGDHDFVRVEHAESMRAAIPTAQLAVVPGCTHNELMHRVDVVAPLLEGFLGASPAGRRPRPE